MSNVWAEWKALTRFLASAQMAFARERDLWTNLELADPRGVHISTPSRDGKYRISLDDHVATITDQEMLYASVLIHSYALAESAACDELGIDSRTAGGIEGWGAQLLTAAGKDWSDVYGGRSGAVEVAVVRNLYAHSTRIIDAKSSLRLMDAGAPQRLPDSVVTLTEEDLGQYRSRLRSLLRYGGIGNPMHSSEG